MTRAQALSPSKPPPPPLNEYRMGALPGWEHCVPGVGRGRGPMLGDLIHGEDLACCVPELHKDLPGAFHVGQFLDLSEVSRGSKHRSATWRKNVTWECKFARRKGRAGNNAGGGKEESREGREAREAEEGRKGQRGALRPRRGWERMEGDKTREELQRITRGKREG